MSLERNEAYLISLVRELCKQPAETGWLRIIRDTVDAKLIKLYGDVRGKHGRYVPFWA